jgi:hypothetical protein
MWVFFESLQAFDQIAFPEHDSRKLSEEVAQFESWQMPDVVLDLSKADGLPRTARASLERHFSIAPGGIPLCLKHDPELAREAFVLERTTENIKIAASDESGFRYGVCELEDRICNGEFGTFKQCPAIEHRITRCFFSPNSRPPLRLDELKDELDYYPEPYLDRIMHDRLNGVWISIYLHDMPSSFFPERGGDATKILSKLQRVVKQCADYGIRCYLFMAEPRIFAPPGRWKSNTLDDLARHPEMGGHRSASNVSFCTSSVEGQAYLSEAIGHIFSTVHGLGGIINIMCQESAHPCALWRLYEHSQPCNCPKCSKRSVPELFSEIAKVMSSAMKKHQPDAEFFGWFYAAFHMPGEPENDLRLQIAEAWSSEATIIHNLETGGVNEQLGRAHVVQDYSLSWAGPSEYFFSMAEKLPKIAAKMQTGSSHEDASVPYFPVPSILYERYRNLRKVHCKAVMQCWYFGCAPGIMNRAAGRLSFDPFPNDENSFLCELARPQWADAAPTVAAAWKLLAQGYRHFPENLKFKWFGPLHNSIVCPWHVFPADLPIAPSYTQDFPKNSGDRFGEYFGYDHTLGEIRELLCRMETPWLEGSAMLTQVARTPQQRREACLTEAIGIQFSSTRRLFDFYRLREEMIYLKSNHKTQMKELIAQEIQATLRMAELCEQDPRLGYHSEVESTLFFPQKLRARAKLLRDCLPELERFSPDAPELKRYRGEGEEFFALLPEEEADSFELGGTLCKVFQAGNKLVIQLSHFTAPVFIEFEPGRMMAIIGVQVWANTHSHDTDFIAGISFRHTEENTRVEFDLSFFNAWRVDRQAPYRFNMNCDKAALHPRKSWPTRLCFGDCNPEELIFLRQKQISEN